MDVYHSFLKRVAHFQVEQPVLSLLLLLSLTLAMYGGVSQVQTVASLEQMMPKDIEEIRAFNALRDQGLGQDMIAVVITLDRESADTSGVMDIRDPRVLQYVEDLDRLISQEVDVLSVYSLSDYTDGEDFSHPELENFIDADYTTTIVLATTDVSANDPRMNLLSRKVVKDVESVGLPPGVKVSYTGTPMIQQRLGDLIAHDRTSTQWISTLFVFVVVAIVFGTLSSALVPIIVVTLSVNWLYGTMGYTNLPISTLAGGVAAMVIGIGIDFAIHIMNKFRYERKKGHTMKVAIELAVVETGTALTATSVTTIAAFLAFLVGQMPEMGRFGILMSIGIGYSLVFSLFGLPALLVIEERGIYWIKKRLRFGVEGEFHLEKQRRSHQ